MQNIRKKVIIIGGGPPPYGGGEEMMELLLQKVPLTPYLQIILLNTRDPRGTANRGKLDLVNVGLALLHVAKLFWMLVYYRPDLVYLSISRNAMLAFFRDSLFIHLSAFFSARIVGHLHGSYLDDLYARQRQFGQWYIRKTIARVDDVIILGENLRSNFDRFLPPDRIHVVYNGIDGTPYWERRQRILRQRTNGYNGPIKILFVGVLKKSKGYHIILHALPEIIKHRKDIQVLFAGEWFTPDEKMESETFICTHNLEKYVKFLGIIRGEQKFNCFADADIFAFPTSYIEGHPIVIVEAMASALPVISTNRGSITEYVVDDQTGYIISENNPEELAEKILFLMEHKNLRFEIGKRCREMFENRFTDHHFVNGVINVWHHALNHSRR